MHASITSRVAYLLLALFALQISASAVENPQGDSLRLIARDTEISCEEYATLANLSTIGTNSTFRGAFLQASPDGSIQSSGILDNATAFFTNLHLINDTGLNDACGNLSAIAIAEAPKNFSEGIVGPFNIGAAASLGSGVGLTAIFTAAMVGAVVLSL